MSTRSGAARLAIISAGVVGSLLAVRHGLRRYLSSSLPQLSGEQIIQGLAQPVEILRDQWGVPHIYAQNEPDLFFAQGFVHAQDRLFQMDVNRRIGLGRLSEIAGPMALPTDRMARVLGWPRAMEATMSGVACDPQTGALLSAYADGVNAFIAGQKLPPAFAMLAYQPEAWQPRDCAAWGVVLAWGLSVNWETELVRARLVAALGPEKAADLTPGCAADYPAVLPGKVMDGRLARELRLAYQEAAHRLPFAVAPAGSNNWVVSGALTATGRPILANDPHLPPLFPAIWYENHLQGGRYHVTGFTTPGVPGVVLGHNERIAWGLTNAFPDIQDLYFEEFHPEDPSLYRAGDEWLQAETVQEVIRVRGRRRPVVQEVRYTRHGPLITALASDAPEEVALCWTAHQPNNHFAALFGMNRAGDWESFCAALQDWGFPPQNVVYADIAGNIGYKMPGKVPRRRNHAGLTPVAGADDRTAWAGWLPFDELPQLYNPAEGLIVTANNRVTDDAYPHLLTGEWLPPYRAERIRHLLSTAKPLTLAACGRIQNDVVSLMARRFLSRALPGLQQSMPVDNPLLERAVILLDHWHNQEGAGESMDTQLVAPTLYFAWLSAFARAAMVQALGEELAGELLAPPPAPELPAGPFFELALELAVSWLDEGAPGWMGDVRPLLLPSFLRTLEQLQQSLGPDLPAWRWGRLHRIHFHHLLARLPVVGRTWKPLTLPAAGDGFTVNQAESLPQIPPAPVRVIASCRLLIDVGDWDSCLSALAGGQSEHPASPHYQDGLAEWRDGRYHPMLYTRRRVQDAAVHTLRLEPEQPPTQSA
jgi:penicillin amidase